MTNHLLVRVINKFGKAHQTIKAMEELAELIVALAKGDLANIEEEVADVEIMLEQIKHMYPIDVDKAKLFKLHRLKTIEFGEGG